MNGYSPENQPENSDRAELLAKARSILAFEHMISYGIDAVDERWLASRTDSQLRGIIANHHGSELQFVSARTGENAPL